MAIDPLTGKEKKKDVITPAQNGAPAVPVDTGIGNRFGKVYDPYSDPKLIKNQGGIASDGILAKGAELLGRGAVLPAQAVGEAVIQSPLAYGARAIGTGINRLGVAVANQERVMTPSSRLPAAQNMLPAKQGIGYSMDKSKTLGVPQTPVDPRFEAMRSGIGGFQSNQNAGRATVNEAITPFQEQRIKTQLPAFGNREAMGAVGGTIRDEQTGETISMGSNGVINRFDASGKPVDKLSARNWGRPEGGGIDSRQLGQSVNYKSPNGLSAEFGPSWSNNDIRSFVSSDKANVGRRREQEKAVQDQAAARAALNGGRGPGPERPARPNISGMAPREANTVMEGYRADLASYDNSQQNFTAGKNNDQQNLNQAYQTSVTGDHYKAQDSGIGIENQAKQLGLDQSKASYSLLQEAANAVPGTPEGDKTIADVNRRYAAMNPPKEQASKFGTLDQYNDEGLKTGQVLYDQTSGKIMNDGQPQMEMPTPTAIKLMNDKKGDKAYEAEYVKRFGKLPY